MRKFLRWLFLAPVLLVFGCGEDPVVPTPVAQPVTVIVNVNQNQGGGGSTDPSNPSTNVVSTVGVAEFGENCPAGSGKKPAEDLPRQVRVGCVSDVTCNPRGQDGKVIFNEAVTGPASFRQIGGTGAGEFAVSESNSFNGTVVGKASGVVVLQCTVKGVTSDPWSMEVVP